MDSEMMRNVLICGAVLLVLPVIALVLIRREKSKRRVRQMGMPQKLRVLNELAEPFGFFYIEEKGIFTSRQDAWQREMGYEALYDKAAPGANMVIDAWPVYFDYEGRTWLIEFWKGQYGINTGGEVGIYHAKDIVPPYFYPEAHFEAADGSEIPYIACRLERKEKEVYELCAGHWWLTGFCMGTFSKPSDLRMMTTITFETPAMAQAFFEGLLKTGKPRNKFRISRNEVYVRMDFSGKVTWPQRMHRAVVQAVNRFYCQAYRAITRPFTDTVDRMLFLYYQLPSCFRRMLRLCCGRYGNGQKKIRAKCGGGKRKKCRSGGGKKSDGMS